MSAVTVTPFLWFDHQAAEAAAFYEQIFAAAPGGEAGSSRAAEAGRAAGSR